VERYNMSSGVPCIHDLMREIVCIERELGIEAVESVDFSCVASIYLTTNSLQPRSLRSHHCDNVSHREVCPVRVARSHDRLASHAYPRRKESSRNKSTTSGRRYRITAVPSWYRYKSTSRFTVLLITLFFLTSSTFAAPLQGEQHHGLLKRQAIPDRFGNPGSKPASMISGASPLVTVTSTETSQRTISSTTSSTVNTPSPATTTTTTPSTTHLATPPSTSPSSFSVHPSSPSPPPPAQFQLTSPQTPLSPSKIAGITLGSAFLLCLPLGTYLLLHRRAKGRQVREIVAVRRIGHYDARIARSRSKKKGWMIHKSSVMSWGNSLGGSEKSVDWKSAMTPAVVGGPVSPSVYSQRLTRATRGSDMSFGSVRGWWDINYGTEKLEKGSLGTRSQLVDVPRPLFAARERGNEVVVVGSKGEISAPRPARPQSAEPLGELSGMGYGLGMR
jgi:hypothetical protein